MYGKCTAVKRCNTIHYVHFYNTRYKRTLFLAKLTRGVLELFIEKTVHFHPLLPHNGAITPFYHISKVSGLFLNNKNLLSCL